jgi:hypothetical protein
VFCRIQSIQSILRCQKVTCSHYIATYIIIYLPPRAWHVKYRLLPEDLIRSPDIGVRIVQRDQAAEVVESSGPVAQMIYSHIMMIM